MPRSGGAGDLRWFDVEPCYVFHPLNAYGDGDGDGDTIVLDVVRHPTMFDTDLHGPHEGPTTLDRWTVDLVDGKVRETRLDDHPQEFPQIDDRLLGRPHRYGYAMHTSHTGGNTGDSVLKHDLARGHTILDGWAPTSASVNSFSSPTHRTPPKTTECSWDSSTTPPPTAAT